jgi:hypothetical protein
MEDGGGAPNLLLCAPHRRGVSCVCSQQLLQAAMQTALSLTPCRARASRSRCAERSSLPPPRCAAAPLRCARHARLPGRTARLPADGASERRNTPLRARALPPGFDESENPQNVPPPLIVPTSQLSAEEAVSIQLEAARCNDTPRADHGVHTLYEFCADAGDMERSAYFGFSKDLYHLGACDATPSIFSAAALALKRVLRRNACRPLFGCQERISRAVQVRLVCGGAGDARARARAA